MTQTASFRDELRLALGTFLARQRRRLPADEVLRIDLHCHDHRSDVPDELLGRILRCPETWTPTSEVVARLRAAGVDAITITNHNNARSCFELLDRGEDVLVGAEFTCTLAPGDARVHVLTYGFDPGQEVALQRRRSDLLRFLEYAREHDDPKATQTFLEFMRAGGPVGWVIFVLGILAALLILARVVLLLGGAWRARGLVARVQPQVGRGDLAAALQSCRRAGGPLGRLLGVALTNLSEERQRLEDRVAEAMIREQTALGRFTSTIMVLASVSPLLGLLGTVTGMIATFDIITEHGTGDPKLLSSGISEALITTELGLIVAIPALLVGTLLGTFGRTLEARLEQGVLAVINGVPVEARQVSCAEDGGEGDGEGEGAGKAPSDLGLPLPAPEPT